MSSPRKGRWYFPVVVVLLAVVGTGVAYVMQLPLRAGVAMILAAAAALTVLTWTMLRSPLSWRGRFLVLLGVAVVGIAAKLTLRNDGSLDGTSMPRLVWKWSPQKGEGLAALPDSSVPTPASSTVPHDDLLQFRGDDARSGSFPAAKFGRDWEANPPKEVWRIPVGLGWGGFSVAGDRAITQEQRGGEEFVTCYDLGSGAVLWAHRNAVRFSETLGGDGPRSTPTIDPAGNRVYAMGATGILDCLALDTGQLIWSRDVLSGMGNLGYGKANAPLFVGDTVVVTGGDGSPTLLAFRKADGAPVWTGGESAASYSSPALLDVDGVRCIVSVNADDVTGHDPSTGAVLWRYPWKFNWPKSAQPMPFGGNRLLLTASYGMGSHLIEVKGGQAEEIWRTTRMKTKFSSVCVKDGYAYGLDEGVLSCIEIESGDRVWKDGRYGFGQNILAGDVLIVQGEQGEVILVEATPDEHRELARVEVLNGKTWNTPALAAPYLMVRNDAEAVCLLLPAP